MKKSLLVALLTLTVSATYAQIYQGQWMVGGNAAFSSAKYGDVSGTKVTTFNISPDVGYFFINNFAGGIRLSFTSEKLENAGDASTNFVAGPFLRYYFLPAAQKVNIFLDGSYGFGSAGESSKQGYNQFEFMAGPAIFLSPNVALEIALDYLSQGGDAFKSSFNNVDKRYNSFGAKVGFQIHLGNRMGTTVTK